MHRLSMLFVSGMLCSSMAYAGSFVTAKGGDPTLVSPGSTFTFTPVNGGGVFFYENIGPGPITEIIVNLTALAGPGQVPYSFQSSTISPTAGQLSELEVQGFQRPPIGTPLLTWDFSSYIFSNISLKGTTTGIDCAGNDNTQAACLTIDFTGGSIGVGSPAGLFGFDLNDNFTADINTTGPNAGTFNTSAGTNPPSGGFAGVTVASGTLGGTNVAPEPGTLGMLVAGAGLVGFGLRRKRS